MWKSDRKCQSTNHFRTSCLYDFISIIIFDVVRSTIIRIFGREFYREKILSHRMSNNNQLLSERHFSDRHSSNIWTSESFQSLLLFVFRRSDLFMTEALFIQFINTIETLSNYANWSECFCLKMPLANLLLSIMNGFYLQFCFQLI